MSVKTLKQRGPLPNLENISIMINILKNILIMINILKNMLIMTNISW